MKVTGPARPDPKARRVIVYSFALTPATNQDGECTGVDSDIRAIETVPVPAPGEDVTFWVRVPSFKDVAYGVELGERPGAVEEKLKVFATCGMVGASPSRDAVFVTDPGCGACECT